MVVKHDAWMQNNRNIDSNTESIGTLIVTAHILSVDSKQGGVHEQNKQQYLCVGNANT